MRRRLGLGLGGVVLLVAAIGFLHTRAGMALLGKKCPFGGQAAAPSTAVRETWRQAASTRLRGDGVASERPAGAFALGTTTRADVAAWATREHHACVPGKDGEGVACDGDLFLDFDAAGVLVAALEMTYSDDAAAQARDLLAERDRLGLAVGVPTRVAGSADAAYLGAAPLRQARFDYQRANYFASVSVTNLGKSGFLLSRLYRAV